MTAPCQSKGMYLLCLAHVALLQADFMVQDGQRSITPGA